MNAYNAGKTMRDKIEKYGKASLIQHGKMNDRAYLMKLHREDFPSIIADINKLARRERYTKIFCKVPGWASPAFLADGFITEAVVPGFYRGEEPAFFLSKFLNSDRLLGTEQDKLRLLSSLLTENLKPNGIQVPGDHSLARLHADQAEEISKLYQTVFKTYPFPIDQPEYIVRTMQNGVQYFGVSTDNKLIALSSAEVDAKACNAEMTDFATLPEHRGKNLSVLLLREMEKSMQEQGIRTLYTIARLNSPAMNKTFLRQGYEYAGTLIMNTHIAGRIESMNVLYKSVIRTDKQAT